jgi:CheY-like chemotaxis protein
MAPRILSLEDNPDTRVLLKHQLGDQFEVTFASSAEEALEALGSAPFELLLIDIDLGGGKSGVDFLREVRRREERAQVPAIALTAYGMSGERDALLEAGFSDHLAKPYLKAELLDVIERAL